MTDLTPGALTALQRWANEQTRALNNEIVEVARELRISDGAASDVVYLRTRSRWTPELETQLIADHRSGKIINIMEWPES